MESLGTSETSAPDPSRRQPCVLGEIEAVYDYCDERDVLLFQVRRFRPKAFRSCQPDGQGGWIANLAGVRRVLYHLPQVSSAKNVLVVEGEKDVETAEALGLPSGWAATCSPFGACQWRSSYTRQLADKRVAICSDNDPPGQDHLMQVGQALIAAGNEVLVVTLPAWAKDLTEWVERKEAQESLADLLATARPFRCSDEGKELARAPRPLADAAGECVVRYDYVDPAGHLLFQVVRMRPKAFLTRRPDGRGGWLEGLGPVGPVLYKLPRVIRADKVLIVEGEKDVETGECLSLPEDWSVTCNPFGVCHWRPEYSLMLAGKAVYLCCDNDHFGQDHRLQVGLSLVGQAREIRVVSLPPEVKDLSEWVDRGGDSSSFASLLQAAQPFAYPRKTSELIAAIEPLSQSMAIVQNLRGVLMKSGPDSTGGWVAPAEVGFLPGEVHPVLPGWIGTAPSGQSVVCIRGFEALATGALQELTTELRDINDHARRLEARLDHLMGAAADGNASLESP